jgi:hypothetical protein
MGPRHLRVDLLLEHVLERRGRGRSERNTDTGRRESGEGWCTGACWQRANHGGKGNEHHDLGLSEFEITARGGAAARKRVDGVANVSGTITLR